MSANKSMTTKQGERNEWLRADFLFIFCSFLGTPSSLKSIPDFIGQHFHDSEPRPESILSYFAFSKGH